MEIKILLVFFGMAVVLIVWIMGKLLAVKNRETKELEKAVRERDSNIAFLVTHADEISAIQKGESEMYRKIAEAKTDEEVSDIVDAVIRHNNERVQERSKK